MTEETTTLFKEQTITEETTIVDNQEQEVSYKEQLVGEGKKFKDEEALAKGKLESDRMIEQLISEKRELEMKVQSSNTIEDLMSRLDQRQTETVSTATENQQQQEDVSSNNSQLSQEQVAQLLDSKLSEYKQASVKEQNLRTAESELTKKYGNNATNVLNQKAKELSVDVNHLKNIAESNPTMFLSLMGANQQTQNTAPNPTQLDTSKANLSSGSGKKNYDYYESMRKQDSSKYFSPQIQAEIHKQAMEQGEAFFNN